MEHSLVGLGLSIQVNPLVFIVRREKEGVGWISGFMVCAKGLKSGSSRVGM